MVQVQRWWEWNENSPFLPIHRPDLPDNYSSPAAQAWIPHFLQTRLLEQLLGLETMVMSLLATSSDWRITSDPNLASWRSSKGVWGPAWMNKELNPNIKPMRKGCENRTRNSFQSHTDEVTESNIQLDLKLVRDLKGNKMICQQKEDWGKTNPLLNRKGKLLTGDTKKRTGHLVLSLP